MDNYAYRDILTVEFLQPILPNLKLVPGRSGTDAEQEKKAFSLKSAKVSKRYKGKLNYGKWQTSGMNWQYDKIQIEEKWAFDFNHPIHILSIFDEDLTKLKETSLEMYPLLCFIFDQHQEFKELISQKREERLKILKERPHARDNISIFLKDVISLREMKMFKRSIFGIPEIALKADVERMFGWKH